MYITQVLFLPQLFKNIEVVYFLRCIYLYVTSEYDDEKEFILQ